MSEILGEQSSGITLPDGSVVDFYVAVTSAEARPGGNWVCELDIRAPGDNAIHPILGVDSLQALVLAFYLLKSEFRSILLPYIGVGTPFTKSANEHVSFGDSQAGVPASVGSGSDFYSTIVGEASLDLKGKDGEPVPLYISLTKPVQKAQDDWQCELRVRLDGNDAVNPIHGPDSMQCLSFAMKQLRSEMEAISPMYPEAVCFLPPS